MTPGKTRDSIESLTSSERLFKTLAHKEPDRLKKEFGKDITFWGAGIDNQKTLPFGSPKEIKDEVRRLIDIMAPGGGFVFSCVHNIQPEVPPENIMVMWATLNEHGKY